MQPEDDRRITRLESQVAYLLDHLGIDPATAAGDWSTAAGGWPAAGPGMSGPLPGDTFDPFNGMPRSGPVGGPLPAGVIPPELTEAIQRGKLIQAIKIYRQLTGVDLKQAKIAVEAMARDLGIRV
jgi:hypothetical protein